MKRYIVVEYYRFDPPNDVAWYPTMKEAKQCLERIKNQGDFDMWEMGLSYGIEIEERNKTS